MPNAVFLVNLPVKPGHLPQVLELFETLMPRVREEAGCLTFSVHTAAEANTVWLYEVFESAEYHDEVHENYPEVKEILQRLPEHLSTAWTVETLTPVLVR